MAIKVSVTVAMEKKLRAALASGPIMEHAGPLIRQLVAAIDDAQEKRARKAQDGGVDPKAVINTIRGILGGKATMPPNPGSAFYGFVATRMKFLNLSLEDIERVALHLKLHGKLPTTVEWIIRKLDTYLAEAEEMETQSRSGGAAAEAEEKEVSLVTGRLDEWQ